MKLTELEKTQIQQELEKLNTSEFLTVQDQDRVNLYNLYNKINELESQIVSTIFNIKIVLASIEFAEGQKND